FVPVGRSIWEFGAGKDYKAKAREDYDKRKNELSPEERAKHTFIFVTPRIWDTGLEEWMRERSADGWLKVQVLDAIALEHWLAENPAVALPLAREMAIIPGGVRTVQDFWDEYRFSFLPTLKEELLERMRTTEFAAGLKSMGLGDVEAFELAVTCGRSLTVLSRLNHSAIAPPPKWHNDPKLVPMVLAGGWNAANEHDRAVVAKLCNTSYEAVDAEARRLSSLADAPLDLEGSVWALRSATDAFTLLGCLVDTGTQERLREVCIEVFSERDRRLDVPDEARP